MKKYLIAAVAIAALVFGAVALADNQPYASCCGLDHKFNWEANSGSITNETAQMAMRDVPYPLAEIHARGGFLERVNLRERLLRFNDPAKIGYVYVLSSLTGKPIGYYTIKGKISSTDSQLTETQQSSRYSNDGCGCTPAPGDDGTWGLEEGGTQGIFFFTTTGVMVETVMPWLYSDAPLPLAVPSLNPKKPPSSTSSFWKKGHRR